MIEAIHAIVAQTAVRGTWRPKYLAGETILQLDRLPLDEHLLGAWRRAVCGAVQRVWHFYRRRSPQQQEGTNGCGPEMQHQQHRQRWRQSRRSLLTCKERGRERRGGEKEQKFSHFKHFPQWQQQQLIRVKAASPSPSPSPANSL